MDILKTLSLSGLVPVIAINDAEDAVPLCKALSSGGLPVAEITFRTAAAEEAIRRVHEELPEVVLCAGTVLAIDQAERAVRAGAAAIVSPGFNPEVVRWCVDHGVPVCPGTSNATDIEMALSFGLKAVKVFPAEAIGGIRLIRALAAPYADVRFMPTGGINEQNMLDYLSFEKVLCCGGSWMVPGDAVKAKDWQRITDLTRSAVSRMLGFELRHIGINSGSPEQARKDAEQLARLLGWPVKPGETNFFAGDAFECMKEQGRGRHGHIAVATNDIRRARWHLEQRGFVFDESSIKEANGKMTVIYLKDDICGFAIHLQQK